MYDANATSVGSPLMTSSIDVCVCGIGIRVEASGDEVGDDLGDISGVVFAVGSEPVCGPVERAEESAGGDIRIRSSESSFADALGDERADAALVPITLGDDEGSQPAGEGIHLEVRSRALDFVEQAEDVSFGELPDALRQRPVAAARVCEGCRQFVEGPILAEIQQLVLPAEIVIQVRRREVRSLGNVAHAGSREAARSEHARRCLQDAETPCIGAL